MLILSNVVLSKSSFYRIVILSKSSFYRKVILSKGSFYRKSFYRKGHFIENHEKHTCVKSAVCEHVASAGLPFVGMLCLLVCRLWACCVCWSAVCGHVVSAGLPFVVGKL
jgi:hypothetical protein